MCAPFEKKNPKFLAVPGVSPGSVTFAYNQLEI